ncbi:MULTISPECIES: hypothetical protein [Dehalococcoides]|jgi:hypothetical protein|uniref:Uncharacterized protein n=2 Tax=Dehalococcoides mccartyi TaxID=61435 RepID=A0A142VBN5_9CHLR|nr:MULTISPECIES: hypothetical protein [Dehalococcoides]AGG06825.1 hypothetical protein dcmb_1226 [Dehalococcoides mccartyi DCMB5]AGG08320.1 hypothetical protein btf_1245 [Dehalococcoides mccartyi BTF08]AII61323.1 hypothetical protein X794_05820 [Dehalococcoides mccartyi CG5]AMU87021.1 hypothetical protein Dm11a5_1195 [Dehalococcoides mccartyi]AOV99808.1 hypothetical protein DCWBC2_1185 [Dehalococcoides mccartyi]
MSQQVNKEEAINWLIKIGTIPYWDSIDNRPLFRRIVKKNDGTKVDRVTEEEAWPFIINALGMKTEAETESLRKTIEKALKLQGRI